MNWILIEMEFIDHCNNGKPFRSYEEIAAWFKQRIESELPPPPLNEEEKNEFYRTDITADIKPKYGN
jgi:hypothetical protein